MAQTHYKKLFRKALLGLITEQDPLLAKAIGIENISASQVSEITKGFEEQVTAFPLRWLE